MISVALLRGINVGGNNKVDMKKLKTVFESLGFKHVQTYINTGNVIFEHDDQSAKLLAKNIHPALRKAFGFPIELLIIEADTIIDIAKNAPTAWKNDETQKTDVLFLWEGIDAPDTQNRIVSNPNIDTLLYIPGAIIWHVKRENYTKSGMKKFIGSLIYKQMTARNINTTRKLAELVQKANNQR